MDDEASSPPGPALDEPLSDTVREFCELEDVGNRMCCPALLIALLALLRARFILHKNEHKNYETTK